tara:strand:+ start:641 stop:1765 length:1125 start_codon:yes stop_codon:yes gene_type:complete
MKDIKIIKEYLRKRPGYLKCGNSKIQTILYGLYGEMLSLDSVKQAKKEVKKEFKNQLEQELGEKAADVPKQEAKVIPAELIEKFNELARQMGMKGLQVPVSEEDPIESFLQRKQALKGFHVPEIKDQAGMHILLGCNHVPFHNKQLHRGVIELIRDNAAQVKGFHLLGDFLDLNPLSSHDKGRFTAVPGLTLNDEYAIGNELLDDFNRVLPKDCWKTYLYGNHEDRYNRWMSVMDNAKTPLISPEEGLRLWQRGYNVKTRWSQDFITLGNDFDIFHGIYFSIHNAKAHLDKLRRSCAYVHTHRIQHYQEGSMSAFNIGACANFDSKAFNYATRPMKAQWANGFAVNMIDESGKSHMTQIQVDRSGHFYFGGKRY